MDDLKHPVFVFLLLKANSSECWQSFVNRLEPILVFFRAYNIYNGVGAIVGIIAS